MPQYSMGLEKIQGDPSTCQADLVSVFLTMGHAGVSLRDGTHLGASPRGMGKEKGQRDTGCVPKNHSSWLQEDN